ASVGQVLREIAGPRYVWLIASFVPMVLWATFLFQRTLLPFPWPFVLLAVILAMLAFASRHFAYLVLLMTSMMFLSHGTQDLYPDFRVHDRGLSAATASYVAVVYTLGMIVGGIGFGGLSERLGRRRAIHMALLLSVCVIPLWAFGNALWVLV